jgi:hypothetical protein
MQRETKRQKVSRELVMQRAGLALPHDAQLERRRIVMQMPAQETPPQLFRAESQPPAAQVSNPESDSHSEGSDGGGDEAMDMDQETLER